MIIILVPGDFIAWKSLTAQQGVGKTHLLSRIRHRLEREGGALFVYAGVNNYTDLNLVKYQFQQTLVDSLSKTGSQGVMQWQEVAAAIANEGFKPGFLTKSEKKGTKTAKMYI
ncbi:hypothetical protein [Nostoc sp.]|uniref:hypothetical protein n=1 Tax=Nostoc sp. TaxID=1180 RepID=UPI002FF52012